MYVSAALRRSGFRGLVTAPLGGMAEAGRACGIVVREFFAVPLRFPKTAVVALVAALATWALASRWEPIRLLPKNLIAGTVAVISEGPLADPNTVLGLEDPAATEYEAVFRVFAPSAGPYEMSAIYACATRWPLTVSVNGARVLEGAFGESFGGAYNTFAHRRPIGRLSLRQGENTLTLRGSAEDRQPEDSRIGQRLDLDFSVVAAGPGMRTSVLESASDRLVMQLDDVAFEARSSFETPVLSLTDPLLPGHTYSIHVPMTRDEHVSVKVWMESIDERGDRVPGGTRRQELTSTMPDLVIRRLSKAVEAIQLRIDIWGDGRLELNGSPSIREGYRSPGAEYPGPFIEEIVLVPVTEGP